MRYFVIGLLLAILGLAAVDGKGAIPRNVKAEARQTVVQLVGESVPGEWVGYCSAVKLSPHFLITAAHCVDPKGEQPVHWRDSYDGAIGTGEVAKVDEKNDMALVRVHTVCPCAPLARRQPSRDDYVMHIGFPMPTELNNLQILTEGTFQGQVQDDFYSTTAPLAPGNSGGGAFNERGELIGVTVAVVALSSGFNMGSDILAHLAIITNYQIMIRFLDGF